MHSHFEGNRLNTKIAVVEWIGKFVWLAPVN